MRGGIGGDSAFPCLRLIRYVPFLLILEKTKYSSGALGPCTKNFIFQSFHRNNYSVDGISVECSYFRIHPQTRTPSNYKPVYSAFCLLNRREALWSKRAQLLRGLCPDLDQPTNRKDPAPTHAPLQHRTSTHAVQKMTLSGAYTIQYIEFNTANVTGKYILAYLSTVYAVSEVLKAVSYGSQK